MAKDVPKIHGTVVLVDDDDEFREEIAKVLRSHKLDVAAFESASSALHYITTRSWSWFPALLIADIVMDGMGGYQFVQRVVESYPRRKIPVIMVTKLTAQEYKYEAEAAGADDFLVKPISEEDLLAAIHRVTTPR